MRLTLANGSASFSGAKIKVDGVEESQSEVSSPGGDGHVQEIQHELIGGLRGVERFKRFKIQSINSLG